MKRVINKLIKLTEFCDKSCLKEEVAEALVENLVKADLARLLQVLDHHGSHAGIRQDDLFAGSEQTREDYR
jgi:hypothetical protein